MKASFKIFLYNIFTVFFALMTLVSLGGLNNGVALLPALINVCFFALLCQLSFTKEAQLKAGLKHSKKKATRLVAYKHTKTKTAA